MKRTIHHIQLIVALVCCAAGCAHLQKTSNDASLDMHSGMPIRFLPRERGIVACAFGLSISWTADGGRSWIKRVRLPLPIAGMVAGNKGGLVVWDNAGQAYIVDEGQEGFSRINGLDSAYISSIKVNDGLWVAYGKSLHDSIDYDPCFNPKHVMDTSSVAAKIYFSVDGERTWKLVDSWLNRYIVDVFIANHDDFFYLSLYGEIKHAGIRADGSISVETLCGPGKHCYPRTSRLCIVDSMLAYITSLAMSGPYVDEVEYHINVYRKVGYGAFPYNIAASFNKGCIVFDRSVVYLLEGRSRRTLLSIDSMLDQSWSIESVETDGHDLILVSAMQRVSSEGEFSRVLFYYGVESQWRKL